MRKLRLVQSLFTLFIFSILVLPVYAATINGATDACPETCETYTVSDGDGGPYFWSVTGGTPNFGNGETLQICWFGQGTGTISLTDIAAPTGSETTTLSVSVNEQPLPEIVPPLFPTCLLVEDSLSSPGTEQMPPIECIHTCAFSQVVYTTPFTAGNTYDWEATGAISILESGNQVIVEWDDVGFGSLIVTETSTSGCVESTEACIEIMPPPTAVFTTMPAPATDGTIYICRGQTVYFESQTEDMALLIWNFSDGSQTNDVSTQYTFDVAGTYEVELKVSGGCFCNDRSSITIEVAPDLAPEITCTGTVCEGNEATYYTNVVCSNYDWQLSSNGSIVEGGQATDDFITVQWGNGPAGMVTLTTAGCGAGVCTEPVIAEIPIVPPSITIKGDDRVCTDGSNLYSVPHFEGTGYEWTLTGNGIISKGQGTPQVQIDWFEDPWSSSAGTALLIVRYDNCYLGCGGEDTLEITLLPRFTVFGDQQACENTTSWFNTGELPSGWIWVDANWHVTTPDGTLLPNVASTVGNLNFEWAYGSGTYRVEAEAVNPTYCNDNYVLSVNVFPAPPLLDAIEGPNTICPNETYTYEAITNEDNTSIQWQITNGVTVTTQTGNPINVTWGNVSPFSLTATQKSQIPMYCSSDELTLAVEPLNTIEITELSDACLEQIATYSATDVPNQDYEWTISPQNAGTIINGQGRSSIDVFWHQEGFHTVALSVCGQTDNIVTQIFPKPAPMVLAPGVCEGETTIVATTAAYTAYSWKNEEGVEVSTTASPYLTGGFYELSVVDANGCEGNAAFFIDTYPVPDIKISTTGPRGFCPGDPPVTLYAVESDPSYAYQWTLDGNPIPGATNSVYTTDVYGMYRVDITDANSCTATSFPIILFEYCDDWTCGGHGLCPNPNVGIDCNADGEAAFIQSPTADCNVIDFINTSINDVPGSWEWYVIGPAHLNEVPGVEDLNYTFPFAGYYAVGLVAYFNNLTGPPATCAAEFVDTTVLVPVAANFDIDTACVNTPTIFRDLSTFMPGQSITAWSWDFGEPASGAANVSNLRHPMHTYSTAGMFNVTLTITALNGCNAIMSKTIEVIDLPNATTINAPFTSCEGAPILFTATTTDPIIAYEWDFDDGSSGAANIGTEVAAYHAFNTPGNYDVALTFTDVYGCDNTIIHTINISPSPAALGNIAYISPICEGETTLLNAPAGGASYQWSNGFTTQDITVGQSGVYALTITDVDGCVFKPAPAVVDVLPQPNARIIGAETDEWGLPLNGDFEHLEVCEGAGVTVYTQWGTGYTYEWEDGSTNNSLSFSSWNGSLLPVGQYSYTVTVTDGTTGCSAVSQPYMVTVRANPTPFTISLTSGDLCAESLSTISVNSPDANTTYYWSNGEEGIAITESSVGEYFAVAVSEYGCEQRSSNSIFITPVPNVDVVPTGCFTRCKPDTICLPFMPSITSYQWYVNGIAISGAAGTTADLVANDSGDYQVEMTNAYGCTKMSDVVSLDLYDGLGTITGMVFFDENEDALYNVADGDYPLANIPIHLTDGTSILETALTDADGNYIFDYIPAQNYILVFDETALDAEMGLDELPESNIALVGCESQGAKNWAVIHQCPALPATSELTIETCTGVDAVFDGTILTPGSTTDFHFNTPTGCDSVVTVTVTEVDAFSLSVELSACEGEMATFDNVQLAIGDTQEFAYVSVAGCDSIVNVSVTQSPEIQFDLTTTDACWNSASGGLEIVNLAGGVPPYSLSVDGIDFTTVTLFENLNGGEYEVMVQDDAGCIATQMVTIPEIETFTATAQNRTLECGQESINLDVSITNNPSDELSYSWQDGSISPEFTATEAGTYWVDIANACETQRHEITVLQAAETTEKLFVIPTAFSPNEDGINDCFRPVPTQEGTMLSYSFQVYNRWGQLLFDSSDPSDCWEGYVGNRPTEVGVYVWYYMGTVEKCGEVRDIYEKGNVTLLR